MRGVKLLHTPGAALGIIGPLIHRRRRCRSSPLLPTSTTDMFSSNLFPSADSSSSLESATSSSSSSSSSASLSTVAALLLRRSLLPFLFFSFLAFFYFSTWFPFSWSFSSYSSDSSAVRLLNFEFAPESISAEVEEYSLEEVLKATATDDNTVIITTLNKAWAAPGSIFDLFLESFRIGIHTRSLLNHLLIVALDPQAFRRCLQLHTHCYALVTQGTDFSSEAYFMTPDYLKMMWRRIDFLRSVLETGYNFVFTDADIMWFRDPFPRFYPDADFQIACDIFSGNSSDLKNLPNGGFNYVKSTNATIEFYRFWHSSQERYPGYHDQDVFNFIKRDPHLDEIGLRIRFLDTVFFGGFCEPSKDLDIVCTMHANCCFGMDSKLHDLRILIEDWKDYMAQSPSLKNSTKNLITNPWRVPMNCSLDAYPGFALSPKHSEAPAAATGA